MSEIELTACPFCGSRAVIVTDFHGFYAECHGDIQVCHVQPTTDNAESRNEAARMWNTRASLCKPEVSATTQKLIDLLIARDQAGRTKYGMTLDRADLTHDEWLQHMTEELLDGAGYAVAAMRTASERSA